MNKDKRIIQSKLLDQYQNITYCFGTRHENKGFYDIVTPHQVHGNKVAWIDGQGSYEADGLITNKKGVAIGVRTADCVPILFYEPIEYIIGAAHAGWKGTVAQVATRAVDTIIAHGGDKKNIIAVIGPCIGVCCYHVNTTRSNALKQAAGFNNCAIQLRDGKTYVDLGQMNKQQLIAAGIPSARIDLIVDCTSCNMDLFYSHRRD